MISLSNSKWFRSLSNSKPIRLLSGVDAIKMPSREKALKIAVIVLGIGLLISIIPMIAAGFYAHPTADDFGFSEKVYHAVKSGGGLFDVFAASFRQIRQTYLEWQGTYAAVFIFSMQPAAFSENLYFLTTIVMLAALIASTIFFINTVFGSLGFDKRYGLIISFIILILSIQFVGDKYQAFFWWNGCSYYTLFYAFSLVFFSLLIRLYFSEGNKKRTACFIGSLLLAMVIGGGNYTTALLTTILLVILIGIVYINKRNLLPYYLSVFAVLITGFVISMAAPGNGVRAAMVTGESPVKAVYHSIAYTAVLFAKWTGLAQIAAFAVIAVIAYTATKDSKYQYKYPMAVLILSVLVFAAQLTPPLYAIGVFGAGRQVNIYYYAYYLLVAFNIFYLCGWINHNKLLEIKTESIKLSHCLCALLLVICVFAGGCLNYGLNRTTFFDTLLALKDGTPQTYSAEYKEIMSEIESGNTTVGDVRTVPDFFAPLDIEEDPLYWINVHISRYYEVDEIKLKTE